ncbi:hypothetical protein ACP4OV_031355 [Aristida adscensionis]
MKIDPLAMPQHDELDLNLEPPGWDLNLQPPELGPNNSVDSSGTDDHELDYHRVWDAHEQGQGGNEDDDSQIAPPQVPAHEDDDSHVQNQGSNVKRRRYYSDDLKVAIYLELLAKTDPPVLRRGVSKQVAHKFDVPLRLVQQVWRNGQDYGGIEGVKNKLVNNCGRKRIEIDMEAIKGLPFKDRTTIEDLATMLGVKKSTLHSRLKEGFFRQHTDVLKFSLTDENKKARV